MRKNSATRIVGPLVPYSEGFRAELSRLGYTPGSAEVHMWRVRRLDRWLAGERIQLTELDERTVHQFLALQNANGHNGLRTVRTFAPLLGWLRAEQLVPPPSAPQASPIEDLLARYEHWLFSVRGLSDRTIERYVVTARRFLEQRVSSAKPSGIEELSGLDLRDFVLGEHSRGLAVGSVKCRVGELQALLHFLHVTGVIAMELAAAVPSVPGWRDRDVPPTMRSADVQAMLDGCDRATSTGLRDLAMLTVLARLGLRASEVAGLLLDDIDWRAGELVVRGKGRRRDRLPLPNEVGQAIAAYLSDGRPPVQYRNVFLTQRAPTRPMTCGGIGQVVMSACRRAGLAPVRSHRLRHAFASDLLRQGENLSSIGQLLRHQDMATTAKYAKVDFCSLRQVAQPWPEQAR